MSYARRWSLIAPLVFFFSIVSFFFVFSQRVSAAEPTSKAAIEAATFSMPNRATIEALIGGQTYTFFDNDIGDATLRYEIQGGGKCDDGEILLDFGESDGLSVTGDRISVINILGVKIGYVTGGVGDSCTEYVTLRDKTIPASSAGNNIWFSWIDSGTIQRVDGWDDEVFVQASASSGADPRVFIDRSDDNCADIIIASTDKRSMRIYRLEDGDINGDDGLDKINETDRALLTPVFNDGCEVKSTVQREEDGDTPIVRKNGFIESDNFALYNLAAAGGAAGEGSLIGGGSSSGSTDAEGPDPGCYTLDNPFSWLICPTLSIIDGFIDTAESLIAGYLEVDLGDDENIEQLRSAWAIFARIASAILVIIGLVMVISTALGSSLFDAYTVKKVLPRLVIATIAIWLSFSLILAYIDIMNTFGRGVASLMLAPFPEAQDMSLRTIYEGISEQVPTGSQGLFTLVATLGAGSALLGIGGIFGLISLAIFVAFGFAIALFTLTLRQMMIIALLILAPLGIAAWILPNTDKTWKLWSGTLNKLLLMFPLIMALIASGKIFAWIFATGAESNPGVIDGFFLLAIPLIAYVAPFFLLPATFKAAGGAFSRITGMVNNRGKGMIDKSRGWANTRKDASKKYNAEQKAQKKAIAGVSGYKVPLTSRRIGSTAAIARMGIRAKAGQPVSGGVLPETRRRTRQEQSRARQAVVAQTQKEFDETIGGDAEVLAALAEFGTIAEMNAEVARLRATGTAADATRAATLERTVGRVRANASRYVGSAEARSAAVLRLAQQGRASAAQISAVSEALVEAGDTQTAAAVVSQASKASRDAGNVTTGTISFDPTTNRVGYVARDPSSGADVFTDARDAAAPAVRTRLVRERLQTLSGADYASLRTRVNPGTGRTEFSDDEVRAFLTDPANVVLAQRMFEDKSAQLSSAARESLRDAHLASGSGGWSDPRLR